MPPAEAALPVAGIDKAQEAGNPRSSTAQVTAADTTTAAKPARPGPVFARSSDVADRSLDEFSKGKRSAPRGTGSDEDGLAALRQKLSRFGVKQPDNTPAGPGLGAASPPELLEAMNATPMQDVAFGSDLHRQLTVNLAAWLRGDLIFSAADVQKIAAANVCTDHRNLFTAEAHFDGMKKFATIARNWSKIQTVYDRVIAKTDSKDVALNAFGRILHGVQDFYAHSNYVELYRAYYKLHHKAAEPRSTEYPTFEKALTEPKYEKFVELLQEHLKTGTFSLLKLVMSDTAPLRMVPIVESDVDGSNPDPQSHSKMAHDDPAHPLHKVAKHLAQQQSVLEIRKMQKALESNKALDWPRRLPSNVT